MKDVSRRIEQIDIENFIWIVYLIIIGLSLYANHFEKKYFLNSDQSAKEKYRNLSIIIFTIAVIVYIYFLYDNYKDYKDLKNTDSIKTKKLSELSLLGSGLIFISGIIYLYIAIVDENIDIELAFN
jgi:predicted secreted protein